MKFQRRVMGALMAAAVLAPALGGCTSFGDQESDLAIAELTPSQHELLVESVASVRQIAGIGEVSATAIASELWESAVMVQVDVSEGFASEQTRAIAATMNRASDNDREPLLPAAFTIRVAGDAAGSFRVATLGLDPDVVVNNFTYWQAIEEAAGTELNMILFPSGFDDGVYSRIVSAPGGVPSHETITQFIDNYDAIAAIVPLQASDGNLFSNGSNGGNGGYEGWSLPGLSANGPLPPKEVIELVDEISQFVPLQENSWYDLGEDLPEYSPEGVTVRWTDDDTVVQGRDVSIFSGEYREEDWPAIVAAAAGTTTLPGLDFRYFSFEREFRFHVSPCDGSIEQTADDQLLFDALSASGIASVEDIAPGFCTPDYY
ncbi:hypothetical protein [Salinibacterium sp. SWN1162]|uniref:hypothetical protein n=1 Tax=Salinibacterium sp. SWN1162 TaxID=2792053 RepID=UPI0018CF2266|nr:hypothetical protein [Salinibacterium sp. SWN1162]MBH0008349.1 hypothetical protein [Salinibacterium sp. SWN1162]